MWSKNIVLKPFPIPRSWLKFRSFDWGFAKPFSCGWWGVSDGNPIRYGVRHIKLPRGAIVRYREWYGMDRKDENKTNIGLRLNSDEVARGILAREKDDGEITYGVADPAIFWAEDGPPIAETMAKCGLIWQKADNKRDPGWQEMRRRMKNDMVYCFDTCHDSVRTIPVLQHDEKKPEDLDTDAEDHAADDWRYAHMSRMWTEDPEVVQPIRSVNEMTMEEAWDTIEKKDTFDHRL
jgi:hypothetical protein